MTRRGVAHAVLVASCVFLGGMFSAYPQNLINVRVAGGSPGAPAGAAVIGSSSDSWNYFPNLGGRASGGGVVTNATTIKDSTGATLSGVSMSMSLNGGDGLDNYTDSANFSPIPSLIMANYIYENNGVNFFTFVFSGLPTNRWYMVYGMGNGNASGQGSTWWADATNGHATASATANFSSGSRNVTLAANEGISWVKIPAKTTSAGALTFRVVRLSAAENGSGGSGRSYLNAFQLQPLSAPAISGLTNQTVTAGNSLTLAPALTGTPTPWCQWRSNNVAIAGATNASLPLGTIQYPQNGAVYSLMATNRVGAITNSMTLTVIVTPAITGLNNQAVSVGASVTNAPVVTGVPAPVMRWLHDGGSLSDGATGNGSTVSGSATSTMILGNAQAADSGVYLLIASNAAGVVANSMTLTVSSGNVAPGITGPTDQTVVQTSNATFSASVSGLPLPALQWRVNGTNLPGATGSSFTVSNVQYAQNGFACSLVASNVAGMATNSATLYVLVPPAISAQPTNTSVVAGTSATFSVTASGVPSVKYQWSRNGIAIAGGTNASLTVTNAQGADNGAVFSVSVSNRVSMLPSSNAVLTVLSRMTGSLLPASGATNIAPDQQLRIVFSGGAPKLGSGRLHVRNAADNSVFATIDTSQFQTITLWSATVTNTLARTVQGSTCQYMPVAIYGNEAWITLDPTNRFAYNKSYYVTFDATLFLDASSASFAPVSTTNGWRFTTKASGPATPTVSSGPTNITVGLDGTGEFATLQGALDWVPQNNTLKRTIAVRPGVYRDFAILNQSRNRVTIMGTGADREDVQIIYPYPSGSRAATLSLQVSDVYVRNITLDNLVYLTNNGVTWAGPINVVFTSGSRVVFDHVLMKGGQDTLYANSGSCYFNRCEVWGSTDFIYGGALAVFDQCDIVEIKSGGGPITAPSTPYGAPYGLVFLDCTFPRALIANGYPYDVSTASTTFQRPWRQDGSTAIINCSIGAQFTTKGWSEWSGRETTCHAIEYGTTLIGGGTVTPAQRQAAGAYWLNTVDPDYTSSSMSPTNTLLYGSPGKDNRVAVSIDPADYTLAAIFGDSYFGLSGWMPTVIPTITSQPASRTVNAGASATFAVTAVGLPDPVFRWMKDGAALAGQTNATLALTNVQSAGAGIYSVVVSNSAGFVISSNAVLALNGPATTVTNITCSIASNGLVLSWPADHTGWRMQIQTNPITQGIGTHWQDMAGSQATNRVFIPVDAGKDAVFLRMIYP